MQRLGARLLPAVLGASAVVAACGDSTGPDNSPASIVVASGNSQGAAVATALPDPIVAQVRNAQGSGVANVSVTFSVVAGGGSVSPAVVTTDGDGRAATTWTLGTSTTQSHRVEARLTDGTVSGAAAFTATPQAAAPVALADAGGQAQTRAAGFALRDSLAARATDQYGNGVPGVAVTWSVASGGGSVSPTTSVTGPTGIARTSWTLGPNPGANAAQATADGLQAVAFTATGVPAPTISGITPATLLPGATMVITGTNFSTTAGDNVIRVDGTLADVQQATPTQITARVPCASTGTVRVALTSNGALIERDHALDGGDPLSLSVGQAAGFAAAEAACNELAPGPGRYVIAVVNGGRTVAASAEFELRGRMPGTAVATSPTPGIAPAARAAALRPTADFRDLPLLRHYREHGRTLEQNLRILRDLGPRAAASPRRAPGTLAAQLATRAIAVNDTLSIRIPDHGGNLCQVEATVRARVVHNGSRGVVLEDIAAPLAGQMDSMYRALGEEFDQVQDPILEQNFGNLLAYDGQTNNDGKIFMLYSKVINDFDGVAGFVSSGDLIPVAAGCPASNEAEIFYGVVPTNPQRGFSVDGETNPDLWYWTMRTVVIHEAKHILSFAERFARRGNGPPFYEDSWLEEATAMAAEELYAREVFGYDQKQNASFDETLFCERRPDPSRHPQQCWNKPLVMLNHFFYVYRYLDALESLTPLGRTGDDDATFYGSGWAFVRWLTDHYGTDEGTFLNALVTETQRAGASNIEARASRPFTELLADFTLAMTLDDRPGFTPLDPVHTMPSWNLRDVFRGLNGDGWSGTNPFPLEFPVAPRSLTFGSFAVDLGSLPGGSSAVFELSGASPGRQLIELVPNGSGSNLYMKIVRVE